MQQQRQEQEIPEQGETTGVDQGTYPGEQPSEFSEQYDTTGTAGTGLPAEDLPF